MCYFKYQQNIYFSVPKNPSAGLISRFNDETMLKLPEVLADSNNFILSQYKMKTI